MEKRALTDPEKTMLLKLLVGGTLAGGAAGLATSYANQIQDLRKATTDANDDPVIEIPARVNESPYSVKYAGTNVAPTDKPPGVTALALALPTLGVPAIFSYAAVRKAYQNQKKKELERELQDSEEAYREALTKGASDSPLADPQGRPFQGIENWGMLAGGAVPLSAIAAAYMTNKLLDRSFPQANKPKTKKLRIRRQAPQPPADANDSETAETDEELEKEAAYLELDRTDATEFLVRTVLGNKKIAAVSELPALILNGSVDFQRTSNILLFRGPEAGFDHVKSAAYKSWGSTLDRAAGIHLMTKSAATGPAVALLAAAEFAEAHPMLCSEAAQIDPRIGAQLEKWAALQGATARAIDALTGYEGGPEELEKQASEAVANVDFVLLTQLCMEKRSFVQGAAKIDPNEATIAGGLGGLFTPLGAAAASGGHAGIESDSMSAAGRSAIGSGFGSAAGAGVGGILGLLLAKMLGEKAETGEGKAMSALAVPGGLALGSAAGGALGGRWAANRHNEKQDSQDERQSKILASIRGGDSEQEEKAANAEVPTHDALNIAESKSSETAEENQTGDDPIPEASETQDIVDQALTELAGVA